MLKYMVVRNPLQAALVRRAIGGPERYVRMPCRDGSHQRRLPSVSILASEQSKLLIC